MGAKGTESVLEGRVEKLVTVVELMRNEEVSENSQKEEELPVKSEACSQT